MFSARHILRAGGALLALGIFCLFFWSRSFAQSAAEPLRLNKIADSVVVNGQVINTKSFLDEAWEAKGRSGLIVNSGMTWDAGKREWHPRAGLPAEFEKTVAHSASATGLAAWVGISIAKTYHELNVIDELARFYSAFLKAHFTTVGDLRKVNSPSVKQKLLGEESGPDSARTLAWYWAQPDGSAILRECYLCNANYFYPAAALVRLIATLKPGDRTPAMNQFVAEYVPLLIDEHVLRPNFTERMRVDMDPKAPIEKKKKIIDDEIVVIGSAAEMLGANAADPKLVVVNAAQLAKLKELVKVGVDRFQSSRTLIKDTEGRMCASYFNGDFDYLEDNDYAGDQSEKVPTLADKSKGKGLSWDIAHFGVVTGFLRSLLDNRSATGIAFPEAKDIEYLANQYAFHVFEGDYKKPLFKNFFDGTDGWYRVNYLGRSNFGVAPSRYCNTFDPSRSCLSLSGSSAWGTLAALDPNVAKIQLAMLDLARSSDPSIACYQPQCFRERYYRSFDTSFSFLDSDGKLQYSPGLIIFLSILIVPPPVSPVH